MFSPHRFTPLLMSCLLGVGFGTAPLANSAPAPRAQGPATPVRVASTQVFATDFESGLPAEFTAPGSAIEGVQGWAGLGPPGNQFGGSFLRYTVTPLHDTKLTLRNLPAHSAVSLSFLLAVIDSWDGTELFQVWIADSLRFNHWFQLATGDASSYLAPAGGLLSSGHNLGFNNGGYHYRDRAYNMGVEPAFQSIPHTADSLVIVWRLSAVSGPAAAQWQGGSDESWAIDNVRVTLEDPTVDVPAPGARAPRLALAGAWPNPARGGRLNVRFALASDSPARLELFDVSGRRVAASEVGRLGPGDHALRLGDGAPLPPGVYHLRLSQGAESRVARAVVVR